MKKQYILHPNHDILFEELTEPIENRIDYIKKNEPANEIPIWLNVMRVLTDEEVKAIPREAWDAWDKAWKAREKAEKARNAENKAWNEEKTWKAQKKARKAWNKAWEEWEKAWEEWKKAWNARDKARDAWKKAQQSPAMTEWHASVCKPDCPWNGKSLF